MALRPLPLLLGLALLGALPGCTPKTTDDGKETGEDPPVVEDCANDADDDADGDIDCDDADCVADLACEGEIEDCTSGIDDDGDGVADCNDPDCADDPACTRPTTETACADGLDDDGDGALDCDDTDCAGDAACAEPLLEANCADGVDDDVDGAIDCDDPDCVADAACVAPATETVCDDGLDDDGDAAIDCDDPDCDGATACLSSYETDCADRTDEDGDGAMDCEDPDCEGDAACVTVPETDCADTVDDDADGDIDCDDSDCRADAACLSAVCGSDGDLGSALGYGLSTGTTTGGGDEFTGSCGYYSAEDLSFTWTAPADGTYAITTDGSDYDTLLVVLDDTCGTEEACDDDGATGLTSSASVTLLAGEELVLVVDGYDSTGNYVLSVLTEREITCDDGVDEDGDGFSDCSDADCDADALCTELVCDDGGDSDADGLTDCDDDDCAAELHCTHPCVDDDLGSPVGASVASGSTAGAGDAYAPTCAAGTGGEDVSWLWTAPAAGVYTFDTAGSTFDTVLAIEEGACSGVELACDDNASGALSEVSLTLSAGEEIALHVDGADATAAGDYVLDIWADTEVDCDDGGDEDRDGTTDCDDSDCAADVVCIPESVCDDGADSDLDAATDCLDADCAADAACDVSLGDYDLGSTTGVAIAAGTTVGAGDDFFPTCSSSTAEDVSYAWVAPYAATWTFDLSGSDYDTIIGVYSNDRTSLACDDDGGTSPDSLTTLALDAGQLVIIGVDGYSSGSGNYVLSIY